MLFACGEKSSKMLPRLISLAAVVVSKTHMPRHTFGNEISKLVFTILSAVEPLDSSPHRPARRGDVFLDYIRTGAYSLLGRGIADPLRATAGNFVRSLPIPIGLSLYALLSGTNLTAIGLACAILSGAVASGLGYTIWYAALPGLTPAQGASVQLSVPVITALAGALMLGEAISLRLSMSSLAILGGIALVFGSRERAPSRSS